MATVGIEFTMKNGEKESFDPVDFERDFKENDLDYQFEISNGHSYSIVKEDVASFRKYDLCPSCGYETGTDGCSNYGCSENPDT